MRATFPTPGTSHPHPSVQPTSRHLSALSAMGSPSVHPPPQLQQLHSLRDLPGRYSAVLLDQFGVLHDGQVPYPGAIEAVRYLHSAGLKLLIISNSSRRSHGALGNLQRMGFPADAFCGVITSGEVTHKQLSQRPTPFWQARRRCLHLTWAARGAISLKGLDLEVTTDPSLADCIVAHGTEAVGTSVDGENAEPRSLEELRGLLHACAALPQAIPMIVANPDVVTVHGSELRTMPGTLAQWYAAAGGEVHLMGKPASIIYATALRMLGVLGVPPEEVIAVGDSLEHDIAGAAGKKIDALFVAGGIHAAALGVGPPGAETQAGGVEESALQQVSLQHGVQPAYVIPYFEA